MMKYSLLPGCILALCILLQGCAVKNSPAESPVQHHAEGAFFLASGQPIDSDTVARLTNEADYILVGERHDAPLHHAMQAEIIRLAATRTGRSPVVGLEMVTVDNEPVLQQFNSRVLTVETLPAALNWAKTWGFDFALYKPIFVAAAETQTPVHALNIPRHIFQALRTEKALTPSEKKLAPRQLILPQEAQKIVLGNIFSMHAGAMMSRSKPSTGEQNPSTATAPEQTAQPPIAAPQTDSMQQADTATAQPVPLRETTPTKKPQGHGKIALQRFFKMQSVWDSFMAERAIALRSRYNRPVIILAGGGHVEYGYGIAYRLGKLDPKARVLLIMPFANATVPPKAAVSAHWNAVAKPYIDAATSAKAEAPPSEANAPVGDTAPAADIFFYSSGGK